MESCCSPSAAGGIAPFSLALLFGTGLLMSVGHCIGMCGPIVSAFSVAQRSSGRSRAGVLLSTALYHLGRVATYVGIGTILGLIGSATELLSGAAIAKGILSAAVGVAMILLAFGLLGWLPTQRWLDSVPFGRSASNAVASLLRTQKPAGHFALGFANGFLPCGPVAVAALTAASTGSPWKGAAAMAAYGMGTIPALLALGFGVGFLDAGVRARLYKVGAVLVLLIGVQLGLRGLHAFGVVGGLRFGEVVIW